MKKDDSVYLNRDINIMDPIKEYLHMHLKPIQNTHHCHCSIQQLRISGYLFLFLYLFSQVTLPYAGTINSDIIQDLSSISGYIVKVQGPKTCIIDLDEQDGITTGDLFSVITEKESLKHPITEKVIGQIHDIKAILRVSQIRKGYAFAQLIRYFKRHSEIFPGDRVVRYDRICAKFIDHSGNGKHIYTSLIKQLPHLKWKAYTPEKTTKNEISLLLHYDTKGLEVKDNENRLIHYYPHPEIYVPSVLPMDTYPSYDNMITSNIAPIKTIGKITGLIQTADFLMNDNQLYMAAATHDQIMIYHITPHHITSIAKKQTPLQHQPIYLSWWRPASTSKPHLAITYWHNQDIESKILVFENKSINTLAYGIKFHLAAFDQNLDNNPETLLGQPMDRDSFWGDNQIYRLAYFDQALRIRKRFRTPFSFTLCGSTIGDLTGDRFIETIWIRRGVLRIYQGKSFLYKTYVGNTPNQQITYDMDPVAKKTLFRSVSIYPRPLIYDLNNDKQAELYVIHAERPLLSQLGFQSQALRTWIKCIQYQNNMFFSQRRSRVFNANIHAFTIYKKAFIVLLGVEDRDSESSFTKIVRWHVK